MFFEPNPIKLVARADVTKQGVLFARTTTAFRFWSGQEQRISKLRAIRGFRPNGEEFDPSWWEFERVDKKGFDDEGASTYVLIFKGQALTRFLRESEGEPRPNFEQQFRITGARALYSAFVSNERIQLYVEEIEDSGAACHGGDPPGPLPLGGFLVELDYGACIE